MIDPCRRHRRGREPGLQRHGGRIARRHDHIPETVGLGRATRRRVAPPFETRQPISMGLDSRLQATPGPQEGPRLVSCGEPVHGGPFREGEIPTGDGTPVEIGPGLLHIHTQIPAAMKRQQDQITRVAEVEGRRANPVRLAMGPHHDGHCRGRATQPVSEHLPQGRASQQKPLLVGKAVEAPMTLMLGGGQGGEQGVVKAGRKTIATVEKQQERGGCRGQRGRGRSSADVPGKGLQETSAALHPQRRLTQRLSSRLHRFNPHLRPSKRTPGGPCGD
jgi:hypothetical protein